MSRFLLILTLLLAVMVAGGCAKKADEPFATSTEALALMPIAVPGWEKRDEYFHLEISLPADEAAGRTTAETMQADVGPAMVVRLSADSVVLIIQGTPVGAGHATPGLLGAYWFERREKNWYRSTKAPQFVETGFSGDAGDVKLIEPEDDLKVLAVENGSCWQGMCGRWLSLYRIDGQGLDDLLKKDHAIQLATDTTGAGNACDVLERDVGARVRLAQKDYPAGQDCVDVSAKWDLHVRKDRSGPADVVIDFAGKRTSAEAAPVESPSATASEPAAESAPRAASAEGGEPQEELLVTVNGVRVQLIYRFRDGQYHLLSGQNPATGI